MILSDTPASTVKVIPDITHNVDEEAAGRLVAMMDNVPGEALNAEV